MQKQRGRRLYNRDQAAYGAGRISTLEILDHDSQSGGAECLPLESSIAIQTLLIKKHPLWAHVTHARLPKSFIPNSNIVFP